MVCPEPWTAMPEGGQAVRWTGMLSPARVLAVLEATQRAIVGTSDGSGAAAGSAPVPFAVMTVWGFVDAPVAWTTQEHGYLNSGDNSYTYVLFPDGKYWLYAAVGPHDSFSL